MRSTHDHQQGGYARSRLVRLLWRWTTFVLRVLLVLVVVQAAGVTHAVEDVLGDCVPTLDGGRECPCDPIECPPGCPSCHAHATPTLPPAPARVGMAIPLPSDTPPSSPLVSADGPPKSPAAEGPFRPPQLA